MPAGSLLGVGMPADLTMVGLLKQQGLLRSGVNSAMVQPSGVQPAGVEPKSK